MMTRRTSAMWLIGMATIFLNLNFSCPVHGQEIARVPASGIVTVERTEAGQIRVVIPTLHGRIVVEVDPTAEPRPDEPGDEPTDAIGGAVREAVSGIPPDWRPRVVEQILADVRYAVTVEEQDRQEGRPPRVATVDDAVRLITSRAIFELDEVGPIFAGQIANVAKAIHEAPDQMPVIERLKRLQAILEAL